MAMLKGSRGPGQILENVGQIKKIGRAGGRGCTRSRRRSCDTDSANWPHRQRAHCTQITGAIRYRELTWWRANCTKFTCATRRARPPPRGLTLSHFHALTHNLSSLELVSLPAKINRRHLAPGHLIANHLQ